MLAYITAFLQFIGKLTFFLLKIRNKKDGEAKEIYFQESSKRAFCTAWQKEGSDGI